MHLYQISMDDENFITKKTLEKVEEIHSFGQESN